MLEYRPKFSSDLWAWDHTCSIIGVTDLGDGWERIIVRDAIAIPDGERRFGAVEVMERTKLATVDDV